jgi:hypothetical protein
MDPIAASDVLTVREIKKHLPGLGGWFEAAAASDERYDDAQIAKDIPAWIRAFERDAQFRVMPKQVISSSDGTYDAITALAGTITNVDTTVFGTGTAFTSALQPGNVLCVTAPSGAVSQVIVDAIQDDAHLTIDTPPRRRWVNVSYGMRPIEVIDETAYFFNPADTRTYFRTRLKERPITTVQRFRLMINGQQLLYTIPAQWVAFDTKAAEFWVIPLNAAQVSISAGAALALYAVSLDDLIPNFLFVDYVAGLPDGWQDSSEWADIHVGLAQYCALETLKRIAEAISPGVDNTSISGLAGGQTLNYSRFANRKKELEADVQAFVTNKRDQEGAFLLASI